MRRAGLFACVLGVLLTGPPAHADTSVDYQGLRIMVPSGWPVYRLGPRSTACVRFDRGHHDTSVGCAFEECSAAHRTDRTMVV